jgi:hypothetical protein
MTRGTLATLRDLMPPRALTQGEALRIAELQAQRLLEIAGIKEPPVPVSVITDIPKIVVQRMVPWPVSGATSWTKGAWNVIIKGDEPFGRRRFTLAHEFKHILDYRHIDVAYPSTQFMSHRQRAEAICDFFAGCLLVPRTWLKNAWTNGLQDTRELAALFQVTPAAIQTRLLQTGLIDRVQRHENPTESKFFRVGDCFTSTASQELSRPLSIEALEAAL